MTSTTLFNQNAVDVLIVGAGLSGISAAAHLQRTHPDYSFHIIESRANVGGTWDLFKYPGIRSDSDMHTLGFDFKPWIANKSIADGPSIKSYIEETITEQALWPKISTEHRVTAAHWHSDRNRWLVTIEHQDQQHQV